MTTAFTPAMDIPAHILDAVQTNTFETSLPVRASSAKSSPRKAPSQRHLGLSRSARSSADDISSISSESEQEHGYQTDFTSLPSEASPDDMQPDDVEDFRDREYPQLKGKTYLDHGGTTLYARSLIEEFSNDLIQNLYGNPHSASTPSAIAGHRVDAIRERALRFFGADPDEYDLVFVANATAAIKLVIDCFKDYAAATNTPVWYGYHKDAHTSLVGVREATKMHRCFANDDEVDIWINSGGFGGPRARQLGLFAYPGQSNMTGRRLPLSWSGRIRKSFHKAATYTLLDAAALASTAPLDLSDPATAPDFVALSFYKIFGFPNVGALIVRKASEHVLCSRKYFGGGTVDMIITIGDTWHRGKEGPLHNRLEDGTLPFHSIFALDHAITVHERLYGPNPMKFISHHTAQLGKQLFDGLSSLKHANGKPLCVIYKDEVAVYGDPSLQGATVAFNVVRGDGSMVGYEEVEEAADERSIFVRSGSLCNPGGMASYLDWSPSEMKAAYAAGHRCTNPTQIMFGRPTGVVRVSLGAMSTSTDVRTLLRFLEDVYIDKEGESRTAVANALQMARTVSSVGGARPASPMLPNSPTHMPVLNTTSFQSTTSQQPIPDTASSWSNIQPESTLIPDIERPRFVPADYIKYRKPWEEEMRKQQYANAAVPAGGNSGVSTGMEIKIRELDDASSSRYNNGTPSVKARKFGRSVVNLLRTKHAQGGESGNAAARHPPLPNPPLSPLHPPDHHNHHNHAQYASLAPPPQPPASAHTVGTATGSISSERSKRSLEKTQFRSNVEALGM